MGIKIIGRKNMKILIFTSCLFSIFLTGCGKKSFDSNTLAFNKDGTITEYMVEDFDENEYDLKDFENEIKTEIENYNTSDPKEKVEIDSIKLKESILKCSVKYSSDNSYFDLNQVPLFYGTVSQAIKAGYSLLTPVMDVKTGEELSSSDFQGMGDAHIIILNVETDVNTYKNIEYISEGVIVSDDHKNASVNGDRTVYIVFD